MNKINILLIGSGGREHALAKTLSESASTEKLFASPGNPGIFQHAENAGINTGDFNEIIKFCKSKNIDLVVVGPEQPLADGLADILNQNQIKCFGPSKNAAQLESSKSFAKDFMARHNIPTADFRSFSKDQETEAIDYVNSSDRVVIKASGLAGGKGVLIPENTQQAIENVRSVFDGQFGDAGDQIVIEEFMEGEEASIFAICDGTDFITLAPSQDHKRAFDDDKGPNTGGMGAYTPAPIVTEDILMLTKEKIIQPVLDGMAKDGNPFIGCLYCGLMITTEGPKVVEFNVRFGDPETQSVLSIFDGDLARLFYSAASGKLDQLSINQTAVGVACNVVLASDGYPGSYQKGLKISGLENINDENVIVYHAGTKENEGQILTNGGRVLSVNARANSLEDAINLAYESVNKLCFDNIYYRKDIGQKGLNK